MNKASDGASLAMMCVSLTFCLSFENWLAGSRERQTANILGLDATYILFSGGRT
jgi:hypothetical protein